MRRLRRQQGFSLIEMMTVMSIAVVISMMGTHQARIDYDRRQAKAIGQELYQYNVAIGRLIAASTGLSPAQHHDAHWLRSSECYLGEATHHFLPCHYFANGTTSRGGLGMQTTLSVAPSGEITARTVFDPIYDSFGQPSATLMNLAASIATGAGSQQMVVKGGAGAAYFCANTPGYSKALKQICQDDTHRIVLYITSSEAVGLNLKSLIENL